MTATGISQNFTGFYQQKQIKNLYPTEFVIRVFLGQYPRLNLDKTRYPDSAVLDLGFGDGRNFPLLHDMGMRIFGTEISEAMVEAAKIRFKDMQPTLAVGSNSSIPFDDHAFDYILACHSCYYLNAGEIFKNNLDEIMRVLKPGGIMVFSLPKTTSYLFEGAIPKGDGHFEIRKDPYGLRNGTVLRAFASEQEVRDCFSPYVSECWLGSCEDDFFGIFNKIWIGAVKSKE